MIDKRRAWAAYRVDLAPSGRPGISRVSRRYLGRVMAKNQPDALARAWAKWPDERDEAQVQLGFSVERATR